MGCGSYLGAVGVVVQGAAEGGQEGRGGEGSPAGVQEGLGEGPQGFLRVGQLGEELRQEVVQVREQGAGARGEQRGQGLQGRLWEGEGGMRRCVRYEGIWSICST